MVKNVVFFCMEDYAGVAYNLHEAINKFGGKWRSRHIQKNLHPFVAYRTDILFSQKEKMDAALKAADVIIFESCSSWNPKYIIPCDVDVSNKKVGVWHGGSIYRNDYQHWIQRNHPSYDFIFAHRDLEHFDPRTKRLNATIDTDRYFPQPKRDNMILMASSPSSRYERGTDHYTTATTRLMARHNNFFAGVIEGVSHRQCLQQKIPLHMFFGEISRHPKPGILGGYGVGLIEAAAFGCVCFDWSDYSDTPIICVRNANDIEKRVERFLDNPDKIPIVAKETRKWVVEEHGYRAVVKKFIRDIEE